MLREFLFLLVEFFHMEFIEFLKIILFQNGMDFFFLLFRASPMSYGDSQARGGIGAMARAMPDPSRVCDLHNSSQQRRILNPLSEARD